MRWKARLREDVTRMGVSMEFYSCAWEKINKCAYNSHLMVPKSPLRISMIL